MRLRKGNIFKLKHSGHSYMIVGKWCGDIVLSPIDADDEECLIYTINEINEFIEEGSIVKIKK